MKVQPGKHLVGYHVCKDMKSSMSRPWAARIRRQLRQVRALFPVTWAGLLVIVGSTAAFRGMGMGRQDLILLIVGLMGLIISAWSVLSVIAGAAVVAWKSRAVGPAASVELECGVSRKIGFSLPSLWWLPFVEVDWSWKAPSVSLVLVRKKGRLMEKITPLRRGVVERIVRRVEIGDSFGLATITFTHTQEGAMRFLPSTGALRNMQVVQGMAGGEVLGHPDGSPVGDRIDMRRYGPGDPIRYVLWKVYARSRELMVRTPEVALSPTHQTVAYLVIGDQDQAAAGAARVAVDHGALGGDWQLGADGTEQIADSREPALDLIVRSGGAGSAGGGAGLQRFLNAVSGSGVRRAVVFVPPRPGPWLERVKSVALAGAADRMEFVVCTDGFSRQRRSGLSRLLLRPGEEDDRADSEALRDVLKSLSPAGSVMVVDRAAGKVFPAEQLAGLMRG